MSKIMNLYSAAAEYKMVVQYIPDSQKTVLDAEIEAVVDKLDDLIRQHPEYTEPHGLYDKNGELLPEYLPQIAAPDPAAIKQMNHRYKAAMLDEFLKVVYLLKHKKVKEQDMAAIYGVQPQHFSRIKSGKIPVDIVKWAAMCHHYGVNASIPKVRPQDGWNE